MSETPELLTIEKDSQPFAMTPATLINELTYANYRFNRQRAPELTPASWRRAIPEFTEAMEQRYQQECHA